MVAAVLILRCVRTPQLAPSVSRVWPTRPECLAINSVGLSRSFWVLVHQAALGEAVTDRQLLFGTSNDSPKREPIEHVLLVCEIGKMDHRHAVRRKWTMPRGACLSQIRSISRPLLPTALTLRSGYRDATDRNSNPIRCKSLNTLDTVTQPRFGLEFERRRSPCVSPPHKVI
jgi:hypothetical protein